MQKLIIKSADSEFLREVQDMLDDGWSVVPGTLIIKDSLHGTQTRYIVLLELSDVNPLHPYTLPG